MDTVPGDEEARMDFAPSARSEALKAKLVEFDNEVVRPAEADLPRPARRVGRPALPAAGDGGAEGRGDASATSGTCSCPKRVTARGSRTSTTRRCAK